MYDGLMDFLSCTSSNSRCHVCSSGTCSHSSTVEQFQLSRSQSKGEIYLRKKEKTKGRKEGKKERKKTTRKLLC